MCSAMLEILTHYCLNLACLLDDVYYAQSLLKTHESFERR